MYTVITRFFNLFSFLELLIKDITSTSISKSIILSFFFGKKITFLIRKVILLQLTFLKLKNYSDKLLEFLCNYIGLLSYSSYF